jgi:hypothetical protein
MLLGPKRIKVVEKARMRLEITLAVFALLTTAQAQTQLKLVTEVSSKMKTGTPFLAKDSDGKVYHGHLVTRPARRMMRNGWMLLEFDEPVLSVTNDAEGRIKAGNKMRLLKVGGSLAVAKIADDSVDGALGATKARYFATAASVAFLLLMKGQEARLRAGDTIEVETRR